MFIDVKMRRQKTRIEVIESLLDGMRRLWGLARSGWRNFKQRILSLHLHLHGSKPLLGEVGTVHLPEVIAMGWPPIPHHIFIYPCWQSW